MRKALRGMSLVLACQVVAMAGWTQIDTGLPRTPVGISTLAVDPLTPSTLYGLTYAAGSIFRSTNSGATWTLLKGISAVQALAIDGGPTSTLYASSTLSGGAVLKSTNAGQTWTSTGLGQVQAGGLAADPVNHGTVYALSDHAIYKTTDAGVTWSAKTNGLPAFLLGRQLAFDAADPSILYAGFAASVYKSTDAGENWVQMTTGLPGGACGCLVVTDPAQSGTIFTIRFSPDHPAANGNLFRLYKSADGGASWKPSDAGVPGNVLSVAFGADSSIYASWEGDSDTGGVVRSTDGGSSWSPFSTGLPAVQGIWQLALSPGNPPALFAAYFDNYSGRGGVLKTGLSKAGGDANWTDSSSGLAYLNAHALAVDPLNSSTVYVAVADGIAKSVDSGLNWNPVDFPSPSRATFVGGTAYVPSLLIDPRHPDTMYASFLSTSGCYYTDPFLRKSADGGATWSDQGATYCATGPEVPLAMDPANSNAIFAAPQDSIDCGAYLFGTNDGGVDWNQSTIWGGFITALAFAPTNPPTLYAASNGSVLKSTDSAITWTDTGFPQSTPSQGVTAITVDPSDGNTLYVASLAGLYKTTDGGAAWTLLRSATDSITALAIEPKSGALYAGTSTKGVLRSSDGGLDWIAINGGLSSLNIQSLAVSADGSGLLYAITAGGVFRTVDSIERISGRRRF